MLRCQAVVTRIDAANVAFRVTPQPACRSCQHGRGCGMALFEPRQAAQLVRPLARLRTSPVKTMVPGQRVELAVSAQALLALSCRAYLVPLALAFVSACLLAPWGDFPAVLGMGLGLFCGYAFNRQSMSGRAGPDITVVSSELRAE